MSRDGWVALPRGAMGLSAVCDCGISWSYSLTIFEEVMNATSITSVGHDNRLTITSWLDSRQKDTHVHGRIVRGNRESGPPDNYKLLYVSLEIKKNILSRSNLTEMAHFIWLVIIKCLFLLLNNLNDINCGHVRKCVMRSIIFWTIYL